jgi:hypothetical protein
MCADVDRGNHVFAEFQNQDDAITDIDGDRVEAVQSAPQLVQAKGRMKRVQFQYSQDLLVLPQ